MQHFLQANWAEAIYWLYQEDDFTPTARYEKGRLHYTVADQVGTITELLTEDGYIDYRQKLNLWGEAEIDGHRHYAANDSNPLKCNHRFVGQYYDDESELHYNRFRYYNPETGQYISHDPIGLLGGFNPYGYVGIPTAFVDPLGLQVCPRVKDRYQQLREQGIRAQDAYALAKDPKFNVDQFIKSGGKLPEWGGPVDYSSLPTPRFRNPFSSKVTAGQKNKMLELNRQQNGGILRSDADGSIMVPSVKSQKGTTPPSFEAQIDHKIPQAKGGTRDYSNLQILTRKQNRIKWDN
ncbi:RHS repeat-associated core domain-containing protein [Aggregatibacter actinomycetemcomitans]|uniref:RHS repeat-associated core domain-containing protein n=1 Tax=Aggregatibacter actinomycetemcomitans TaxID=714 RepID=UPI001F11EA67|nr:RHS repeat-associated core domain-containing protein [Aggregatibacter actinomycetemcomitans]